MGAAPTPSLKAFEWEGPKQEAINFTDYKIRMNFALNEPPIIRRNQNPIYRSWLRGT